MAKKKSFGHYTLEEIQAIEAVNYIIIAGKDLFSVKGQFFFSQANAVKFYKKIYLECSRMLVEGTPSQKRNAKRVLKNLHVEPLRIH
jgi:hypothetical protein